MGRGKLRANTEEGKARQYLIVTLSIKPRTVIIEFTRFPSLHQPTIPGIKMLSKHRRITKKKNTEMGQEQIEPSGEFRSSTHVVPMGPTL